MLRATLQEAKVTLGLLRQGDFITNHGQLNQACVLEDYGHVIKALDEIDKKPTLAEKQSAFTTYAHTRRAGTPNTQLDICNATHALGNELMLQCYGLLFPEATPNQMWHVFAPEVTQWHELSIEPPKKVGKRNYSAIVITSEKAAPSPLSAGYVVVSNTALHIHLGPELLPNIYAFLKEHYPQHLALLLTHPQQSAIFHALASYDTAVTPRVAIQRLATALARSGQTHMGDTWAAPTAIKAVNEFTTWFATLPATQQEELMAITTNGCSLREVLLKVEGGDCAETTGHQLETFTTLPTRLLDASHTLSPQQKRELYDRIVADAKKIGDRPLSMAATALPIALLKTLFETIIANMIAARGFLHTEKLAELLNASNDHTVYQALIMHPAVNAIINHPQWFSQVLILLPAEKIKTLFNALTTERLLTAAIPNFQVLTILLSSLEGGQRTEVLAAMQTHFALLMANSPHLDAGITPALIEIICCLSATGNKQLLTHITAAQWLSLLRNSTEQDRSRLFKSAIFGAIGDSVRNAIATAYRESATTGIWSSVSALFKPKSSDPHIILLQNRYQEFKRYYLANKKDNNHLNIVELERYPIHERWALILLVAQQQPQSVVANALQQTSIESVATESRRSTVVVQ